ncbi:MAG TPA: exodeoxyribonuclease VII large subunit [Planctomycetota bacterium]|nr:exodeoxyribonuclease VII large subunit [Planctomycetota bacterium]
MPEEHPLSVSALTRRITLTLEDFGPLLVQGELSQVKVAPSGHLYATLKDQEAVISLVMWRSAVVRQTALPKEGEQVVVRGSLSVYGPRGQYQLTATRISPVGIGDLAARFAALKARLEAEGLFAEENKQSLPLLPRAVGLATASGSAALADMLHSLRARFPAMPIVVAPCMVQGAQAVPTIVAALKRLDAHPEVEVIIVGRGGGSIEDLWAFNEEAVVRAIAACKKPVVSAVGHETDTTLADFVADVRAKTPTAAGELVVPVQAELHSALAEYCLHLDRAMDTLLEDARERLTSLAKHCALATPAHQVALRRQRLDELQQRLEDGAVGLLETRVADLRLLRARLEHASPRRRIEAAREVLAQNRRHLAAAAKHHLAQMQERFVGLTARLEALSPLAVIARGYSVVRTANGKLVRRTKQVADGDLIEARMPDGWIRATVCGRRAQRLGEPETPYQT